MTVPDNTAHRASGGPFRAAVTEPAPRELYDFDQTDEMGLAVLAAYEDVRDRLVTHFAYDPALQRAAAGVVDDLAREHIATYDDDEEPDDDDDA